MPAKPYELVGDMTAGKVYQLNQMLDELYGRIDRLREQVNTGQTDAQQAAEAAVVPPLGGTTNTTIVNFTNPDVILATERNTKWLKGPWTLDSPWPAAYQETVPPVWALVAGTYNDYAPEGVDKTILFELYPTGAVTLTGIKQLARIHRIIWVFNRGSSVLTLSHADTGSTDKYRFKLPGATSIQLGADEGAALYYNPLEQRWMALVTPMTAGGIATTSAISTASINITEAQLEALGTTPQVVVAAPGAGKIIVPVRSTVEISQSAVYSTSPTMNLQYNGITSIDFINVGSDLTNARNKFFINAGGAGSGLGLNSVVTNKALEFGLSANPGTPGTGVATARVTVAYFTLTSSAL